MKTLDIIALVVFVSGSFFGFLVTSLLPVSIEYWWLWPGFRVLWQLGAAIWCAAGLARAFESLWVWPVMTLLGLLLSFNAVLDLVAGPLVVEGWADEFTINHGTHYEFNRGVSERPKIESSLSIKNSEGVTTFEPIGYQSNRLNKMMGKCPNSPLRVVGLLHLDIVMSVDCVPESLFEDGLK